jgi:hypothetical protein
MDMALRRRLDGVAEIRISQERQTAEVLFTADAQALATSEFRAAVGEADVEVLRFEIDVCGRFEREGATTLFVAASNRFLVADEPPSSSGLTCLSADLNDGTVPALLRNIRPLSASQ